MLATKYFPMACSWAKTLDKSISYDRVATIKRYGNMIAKNWRLVCSEEQKTLFYIVDQNGVTVEAIKY